MQVQYLPSTIACRAFKVYLGKSDLGENCLFAVEGCKRGLGIVGEEYIYPPSNSDRSMRVSFGRNTRKNREHAYAVLLDDLVDADMVPKGTAICTD